MGAHGGREMFSAAACPQQKTDSIFSRLQGPLAAKFIFLKITLYKFPEDVYNKT